MTSASFNPIQIKPVNNQQSQPLNLKQGQVFHGTIKRLYPDQMAEVQIGSHTLIAKLETPLKAGDAHFFQVTSASSETQLKVVSGPMSASMTPNQQINQLLESMNLPKSSEMQQILAHFVKEQIPISKEQLVQAEIWLKNLPEGITKMELFSAVGRMVELKMPFTNEVLNALLYGSKTNGMSQSLAAFKQLLIEDQSITNQVKTNLLSQLQKIANPLEEETGGVLLSRSIQALTDGSESIQNKLQSLNLLKEAHILPRNATLQNWMELSFQQHTASRSISSGLQLNAGHIIQMIATANSSSTPQIIDQVQTWIANQDLLSSEQKSALLQLLSQSNLQSKKGLELIAKQLHEQLLKSFSDNTLGQLFKIDKNGESTKQQILSLLSPDSGSSNIHQSLNNIVNAANQSNQPVIQQLMTQIDSEMQNAIDSKAMEQALKSVLKGLGISYEASLNKGANIQELAVSLKSQLLSLVQDPGTSVTVKDASENLLARFNGMQLLSGESGHQHQLVMQLPMQFFGKQVDATLQWNGRMQENGKIDANYARVLFYLDMEHLQETVIDMQVQNRIVTIHLYNHEQNLEVLATSLKESLKRGLIEKDYHLSGVFFKQFESIKSVTENSKKTSDEPRGHNGVDIRV